MKKDERIDAYITSAPEFAKPILLHLRELAHKTSPHIEEDIKWGMPFFNYKGMLCSMAAFKKHCAFNIFKFKQMQQAAHFEEKNTEAAGQFGKITSLDNLPPDDVIIGYLREAMKLNEAKTKPAKKKEVSNAILFYPEGMETALNENEKAKEVFEKLSYSHKKEYVEWIAEAKTEATRNKRIATMIEWLPEGKRRNWKYEKAGPTT